MDQSSKEAKGKGKGSPMPPAFVPPKKAAQYLGVSLATVYRLMKQKAIPVYRMVSDAPRLKLSDLDAFAMSRQEEA